MLIALESPETDLNISSLRQSWKEIVHRFVFSPIELICHFTDDNRGPVLILIVSTCGNEVGTNVRCINVVKNTSIGMPECILGNILERHSMRRVNTEYSCMLGKTWHHHQDLIIISIERKNHIVDNPTFELLSKWMHERLGHFDQPWLELQDLRPVYRNVLNCRHF